MVLVSNNFSPALVPTFSIEEVASWALLPRIGLHDHSAIWEIGSAMFVFMYGKVVCTTEDAQDEHA
jgi:hypothetical protein